MDIVIGATGHVGSALTHRLLTMGKATTIVTHSPQKQKVQELEQQGAKVAVADVYDTESLHDIFQKGERLFMLNPPGDFTKDSVQMEKQSVQNMLEALVGTPIKKVVAESTYGATKGDGIGDLGILYEMEEGLRESEIPLSVVRGAYYMSNWDGFLQTARDHGYIPSFYPENFKLSMVSPKDLGEFGAKLMTEPITSQGIYYVEGPRQYTPREVARAFGKFLGRDVRVHVVPEDQWVDTLLDQGFSPESAQSMAKMTEVTLHGKFKRPPNPVHGSTTLESYIAKLVHDNSTVH